MQICVIQIYIMLDSDRALTLSIRFAFYLTVLDCIYVHITEVSSRIHK